MKFAFVGTPGFGAWVLSDLVDCGRAPALVISQISRAAGRGKKPRPPEVVTAANAMDLPVLQAQDINDEQVAYRLRDSGVDTLVVAAFGQILGPDLLDRLLCVNVHPSLLPNYRGASPIVRALMDGAPETGVCVMRMTSELDEGPVSHCRRLPLEGWEDAGAVERALALLGAQAVGEVLRETEGGGPEWRSQDGQPSYAEKIHGEERWLDFADSARRVHNKVRALSPSPGARARLGDIDVTVWRTRAVGIDEFSEIGRAGGVVGGVAGGVAGDEGTWTASRTRLLVGCGEGALDVLQIQPSGKKVMGAADFLRGYGNRLGLNMRSKGSDGE